MLHEIAHAWHTPSVNFRLFERFFHTLLVLYERDANLNKFASKVNVYALAHNLMTEEVLAWSDACRVLYCLRKLGMDLEPQMDDKKVYEMVNECLGTYHVYVKDKLAVYGLGAGDLEDLIFIPFELPKH